MPLKFECNQDPRKMKTVNGKKFCEQCQKHVYDVRRKSVARILRLESEVENPCMIIYEDQLELLDMISGKKKNSNKKIQFPNTIAAGLLAASLVPAFASASSLKNNNPFENEVSLNQLSGETQREKDLPPGPYTFKGKIEEVPARASKKQTIQLIYEDSVKGVTTLIEFTSDTAGNFSFTLSPEQVQILRKCPSEFHVSKKEVVFDGFDFENPAQEIIINIFKKHRGSRRMGAKF